MKKIICSFLFLCAGIHLYAQKDTALYYSIQTALANPEKVTRLFLSNDITLVDFQKLDRFVNLEVLTLSETRLQRADEIARLPNLKRLYLKNNKKLESLPVVPSLELLDMFGNIKLQLLPQDIINLKMLKILNLDSDSLILPGNIGGLSALQQMRISGREKIIFPVSIGDLQNLVSLKIIASDGYEIPATIGRLSKLESLTIYGRGDITLPGEIGLLPALTYLKIEGGSLTIPAGLGRLPVLKKLVLEGHVEALPASIGGLANLEEFEIANWGTPLVLPASMAGLIHLKSLTLKSNISERQPEELANMQVEDLKLEKTSLTKLPLSFCKLKALQILTFSGNAQLHAFTEDVKGLEKLTALYIADQKSTDLSTLRYFAPCKMLRSLNIRGAFLKAFPEQLSSLAFTQLKMNYLVSPLETDWKQVMTFIAAQKGLKKLELSGNFHQFKKLPEAFTLLQQIDTLILSDNYNIALSDLHVLSGIRIGQLDLSECDLSQLPAAIELLNVRDLVLHNNKLKALDPAIIRLRSLEKLDLNHQDEAPSDSNFSPQYNTLTDIAALLQITNLKWLDLRGNSKIKDKIPDLRKQLKDCTILY